MDEQSVVTDVVAGATAWLGGELGDELATLYTKGFDGAGVPAGTARASGDHTSRILDYSNLVAVGPREAGFLLCVAACGAADMLDLSACQSVVDLDVSDFVCVVRRVRCERGSAHVRVRGLRLDACSLRELGPECLEVLEGVTWVSMRGCGVSSLWSARDIAALPGVTDISFGDLGPVSVDGHGHHSCVDAGPSYEIDDEDTAGQDRHSRAYGTETSLGQSGMNEDERNAIRRKVAEAVSVDAKRLGGLRSMRTGSDTKQRNDWESSTGVDGGTKTRPAIPVPSKHPALKLSAEVCSQPHYRSFIIATGASSLLFLDGIRITGQERADAVRVATHHFQILPYQLSCPSASSLAMPSSLSQAVFLPSRLCDREMGLSRLPVTRPRTVSMTSTLSPPKRKRPSPTCQHLKGMREATTRTTAVSCGSAWLSGRPSSAGDGVVLAVPSVSGEGPRAPKRPATASNHIDDCSKRLVDVHDYPRDPSVESLRAHHAGFSGSASTMAQPAAMATAKRSSLCLAGQSLTLEASRRRSFMAPDFESAVSMSLAARRGSPSIEYLCQSGMDRPRQFEFNPAEPSQLVYGTEHGDLVVLDQESGHVIGACRGGGGAGTRASGDVVCRRRHGARQSHQAVDLRMDRQRGEAETRPQSVLALSWLNKESGRFIAGSSAGTIHVYNVDWMRTGHRGGCMYACDSFDRLTSIHTSCDDSRFAVSGRTSTVGLYDTHTGVQREVLRGIHQAPINVIKFGNTNPHILATSSFDMTVKKWDLRESRPGGSRKPIFLKRSKTDIVMVCFSPDDKYLLASAVDNEVLQYSACDGRLELEFDIPKTGSGYNFTRSYYMNGRDYIVTGSSQESVVRIFNARSGHFFREVEMDSLSLVQSLRANPFREFNFSVLLASCNPSVHDYGMIANVDLRSRLM